MSSGLLIYWPSTRTLSSRQTLTRSQRPRACISTAASSTSISLEDEEGLANLIVRPHVYERYRAALPGAPLLWVEGRLQHQGAALSVLVEREAALGG